MLLDLVYVEFNFIDTEIIRMVTRGLPARFAKIYKHE